MEHLQQHEAALQSVALKVAPKLDAHGQQQLAYREPTGAEHVAQKRDERPGESSDSEPETTSSLPSRPLLAPPVSMMLAVSSRYQLRPWMGVFILGGLIAFAPIIASASHLGWLAMPAAYLTITIAVAAHRYRVAVGRPPSGTAASTTAMGLAHASRSPSPSLLRSLIFSFKQFAGWRLDLESEQRQDDVPSWTALALVLGYAWLIIICGVVGATLRARPTRTCGGVEQIEADTEYTSCGLYGWGGGVTLEEYQAAIAAGPSFVAALPHFGGHPILLRSYTGGPVVWRPSPMEQRMLLRVVNLSFWFYFSTTAVVTLVLAWGSNAEGKTMVWKQLQAKHRKALKRNRRKEEGRNAQRLADGHRGLQVAAPSGTVVSNHSSSPLSEIKSPLRKHLPVGHPDLPTDSFERWLWSIAESYSLAGLQYLLLLESDRLDGLRHLQQEGRGEWDELSDEFLHQYLVLLEVVGQLLLASKMWANRTLDGWFLTPLQKDAACMLHNYEHKKRPKDVDESPHQIVIAAAGRPSVPAVVDADAPHASPRSRSKVHPTSDANPSPTHTATVKPASPPLNGSGSVGTPPAASPLLQARIPPSLWKLCSLVVACGLALWVPCLAWLNYRSYVEPADHILFVLLYLFVATFTYLVGRVLQYPYLCYSEAWASVLTLYHTNLELTRRHSLKAWRDLRHYLVLYRLPLLFGLAQWSLMTFFIAAVIGLLLCAIKIWLEGFIPFIQWYGNQTLVVLAVVSTAFSFGMLASAVNVWDQQQAHIRLLQDTKFKMLLKQKRRQRAAEEQQMSEVEKRQRQEVQDATDASALALTSPSLVQRDIVARTGSCPPVVSSPSLVEEPFILRSVDELMRYIGDHDQAPQAFGVNMKPTLFRMMQGYIATIAASLLIKYGAGGTS